MKILAPLIITPRLLPGAKVGGGCISIEYDRKRRGEGGRVRYHYYIDLPKGVEYTGNDLQSGASGGTLQQGLESLVSFLEAAGEAYRYAMYLGRDSENADMFPGNVNEWAYQNSDELSMLQIELQETPDLIQE